MSISDVLSAIAIVLSAVALVHTFLKSRREERRAQRAEERFADIERKQKEDDLRRARSEAPLFVPVKLWGGTQDTYGNPLSRLVVKNEGRDCTMIEVGEAEYSLSQRHVRNGEEIQITYRSGMFEKGHQAPITFRYETSAGFRGTHKYRIGIDAVALNRVEP